MLSAPKKLSSGRKPLVGVGLIWMCLAWLGFAVPNPARSTTAPTAPPVLTSDPLAIQDHATSGHGLDLLPHARILRDPDGALTIAEILEAEQSSEKTKFMPLEDGLSAGYINDAIWLRLDLARATASTEALWLVVWPPLLDHLDLFAVKPDGSYRHISAGNHVPVPQRALAVGEILFPIELDTRPRTFFLRVQSASSLTFSLHLITTASFAEHILVSSVRHGAFIGLILTALMASVLGSFWLRQRMFYLASAYLICLGLLHLTLNGHDQLWIYPTTPWLADHALGLLSALSMAMTIWFVMSNLGSGTWSRYPRLNRLLQSFAWVFVALGLGAALGLHAEVAPLFQMVTLVALGLILVLCVLMLAHQRRQAILMLATFVPVMVAIWLRVSRNLGLLPDTVWTTTFWEFAIFMLVAFLMLIVLLRMREEQRTHQDSQVRQQEQQRFLRLIAHELRTPLAVIDAAIANLEARVSTAHPDLQPRFQRLHTALARLNMLVDNALLEDRLRGAHLPPQREPIRPSQLAAQTRELLVIDERRHPLRISLPEDDRPIVLETHWMVLAVLNLLDNAVKYSPTGGPVELEIQRAPDRLSIHVADRGIGIPPAECPQLFNRFFRATNAQGLPGVSGVGLGLYLVRQVVERHDGQVVIESRPGGGSILTMQLPIPAG